MRRTRLVILPGARCLTQMCCLLLYLSCPNIGALCRERLDISREDLYSQAYLDIQGCTDLNKEGDEMCYVAASRINCKTKYTGNHNGSDQFIGTGTLHYEIKNSVQPVCQGKACRENDQEIHFNSILNYGSSELQTHAGDVESVRKIRSSPATRQTTMNRRISRDNNELESSRISRVVRSMSDNISSRREEVSRRRENTRFALGRSEGQQSTRQVRLSREFNTNRVNDRRSIQRDNVLSNFRQREEESQRRTTTSKENRRTDVRLENTRRFHETNLKRITTERDTRHRNEIVDTRRIVRENVVAQRTFAELRASRNNNALSKRFDNRQRLAVRETQDSRQLTRQPSRREEETRRVSVVRLPEKQKTEIFDSRTELRRNSNEQIRRNVREMNRVNIESELPSQRRSAERVNQQRRIEGRFRDTPRIREFSGRRFSEDQNRESREIQFRNQRINNANSVRYDTDYRRTTENTQNRRLLRENRGSDRVSARASLDSQRREFSPNRKNRDSNTVRISREEPMNSDSRVNRRTLNRFDNIQNRRSEKRSAQRITDTTNQVLRVSSERISSELNNRRTAVNVQQSSRRTESSRDNRDNERRVSRLSPEFRRVSSDSRLDITSERRNNMRNSNLIQNTRRAVSEMSMANVNIERASKLSSDIVVRRNRVERKNVRNKLEQSQRSNFNVDKREVLRITERREDQRKNQFLIKRSSSEPDLRHTARQFDDRRSNRVQRDTTRLLSERLQEYRSNKQFESRRTSFEPSVRRETIQDNSRKSSERLDNSRYNLEERLINRQNYRRNENRLSREPEIKRFSYERDIRRTSDRLETRFSREDGVRRLASERTANEQRINDLQRRTREIENRRILFTQMRQRNTEYADMSPVNKVRTITDFRADRIDERRISKESQIRRSSENNALQSRRLDQRVNKLEKRINEENVLNRQNSDRVSSRRVFRKSTVSENSVEHRVRRMSRLDKTLSEQNERSLDRRISQRRIRQVEGIREGSDRQRRLLERVMSSNVEPKTRRFSNVRREIPTSSLRRTSSDDRHLQAGNEEIIRKQRSIIQNSETANNRRIVEVFRVRSLASEENARRNTREHRRVLIRDLTGIRLERSEHLSSRRRDERLDNMKMLQRLSSRRSTEENESGRRFNRNELNRRRELQEVSSNHRRSDSLVDTGKLLHRSSRIRDIRYISLSNDDRRNNNQLAQKRFSRRIDDSAKLSEIKAREFISTDKVHSSKYIQYLSGTNNLLIVNVAEMSNLAANLAENATELGADNKYLHLDGSSAHEYANFDLPLSRRKMNAVIPTDKAESETLPSKQKPISMVLQNMISAIWPLKEETRAALVGSVACILLTANVK